MYRDAPTSRFSKRDTPRPSVHRRFATGRKPVIFAGVTARGAGVSGAEKAVKEVRQKGTEVTSTRQILSMEKFCSTVAKMQKNQMTTHNV